LDSNSKEPGAARTDYPKTQLNPTATGYGTGTQVAQNADRANRERLGFLHVLVGCHKSQTVAPNLPTEILAANCPSLAGRLLSPRPQLCR
jgi:hypothetical protein